jgi:hypothetical protein
MQLSSAALERLIGTDPQFELELKQNVVASFYQRRIKAITNDEAMKQRFDTIDAEARSVFAQAAQDAIGTLKHSWGGISIDKFHPAVEQLLTSKAQTVALALFHKMVEDKIAELLPDLPARVERKIEMTLNAMVQAEVKRRLHTLAEEPKT